MTRWMINNCQKNRWPGDMPVRACILFHCDHVLKFVIFHSWIVFFYKPRNSLLKHSNCLLRCRWLAWENGQHWRRYPGFPAKWRLRNERRNSILMTRHYPDLGSASDWSCRVGNSIPPIRSNTQICVVTRHQYGIPCSFLRRHLVGKPVVALPNVRCFLRLGDNNVGRSLWKILSKSILAGATLRVFH